MSLHICQYHACMQICCSMHVYMPTPRMHADMLQHACIDSLLIPRECLLSWEQTCDSVLCRRTSVWWRWGRCSEGTCWHSPIIYSKRCMLKMISQKHCHAGSSTACMSLVHNYRKVSIACYCTILLYLYVDCHRHVESISWPAPLSRSYTILHACMHTMIMHTAL